MNVIRDFFTSNETVLFFVYGQVYFILALSIVLRAHSQSRLELARTLPLLAAFGLAQALVKWGNVFIPIQAGHLPSSLDAVMRTLQLLILGLSFMFLFAFGLQLLSPRTWSPRLLSRLPIAIYLTWAGAVLVAWLFQLAPIDEIIATADVFSRYLLALPGGLLAAAGLRRQALGAIATMGVPTIVSFLRTAGIALTVYAFLAGLLGPPAPFFPANWLNQESLRDLVGVPVALFRALVGLVLTYSILQALKVFQVETNHWIEEMERAQTLAADRERIGRELHDGTIQSIYAAGLVLEDARLSLANEPERARVQLDRAVASLNHTIHDIRSYIFDLRRGEAVDDIESSLGHLIRDFRVNTLIEVDFSVEGKKLHTLEPDRAQNLYQIAREALTNVARHAQASHVDVRLRYGERQLTLRIADDGIGFPASGVNGAGRGLKNMRERAQLLEGALVVEGTPSEGVTVVLTIPTADHSPRERRIAASEEQVL
jgi:signal transduction histidine kinase